MTFCKNLTENNPVDEFVCSECGFAMRGFERMRIDDDMEPTYYEFEVKYCPNCGAKVEKEEQYD